MMTDQFERALSEFLDGEDYDRLQERLQESLFLVTRQAFAAGWAAAQQAATVGGQPEKD